MTWETLQEIAWAREDRAGLCLASGAPALPTRRASLPGLPSFPSQPELDCRTSWMGPRAHAGGSPVWSRPLLELVITAHGRPSSRPGLVGGSRLTAGEGHVHWTRAEVSLTSAGICVPCISAAAEDPITLQNGQPQS